MAKQMTTCCCGCSLRTGTLLIGMVGIFGSVSAIMNGFYGPEFIIKPMYANNTTELSPNINNASLEENSTEISNVSNTLNESNATGVFRGKHRFRISYQGVTGGIELALCILLIVGTLQAKPRLVYPWIAMNIIFCVISVIVNIIVMIFVIEMGGWTAGFLYVGVICFIATLHVYCLLVVNSFYNNLLLMAPIDSYA